MNWLLAIGLRNDLFRLHDIDSRRSAFGIAIIFEDIHVCRAVFASLWLSTTGVHNVGPGFLTDWIRDADEKYAAPWESHFSLWLYDLGIHIADSGPRGIRFLFIIAKIFSFGEFLVDLWNGMLWILIAGLRLCEPGIDHVTARFFPFRLLPLGFWHCLPWKQLVRLGFRESRIHHVPPEICSLRTFTPCLWFVALGFTSLSP